MLASIVAAHTFVQLQMGHEQPVQAAHRIAIDLGCLALQLALNGVDMMLQAVCSAFCPQNLASLRQKASMQNPSMIELLSRLLQRLLYLHRQLSQRKCQLQELKLLLRPCRLCSVLQHHAALPHGLHRLATSSEPSCLLKSCAKKRLRRCWKNWPCCCSKAPTPMKTGLPPPQAVLLWYRICGLKCAVFVSTRRAPSSPGRRALKLPDCCGGQVRYHSQGD